MIKSIVPVFLCLLSVSCSASYPDKETSSIDTGKVKSDLDNLLQSDHQKYSRGDLSGVTINDVRRKYLALQNTTSESDQDIRGLAICFSANHGLYDNSGSCAFEFYASQYMHDPKGWQQDKIDQENKRCAQTPGCERDEEIASIKEHLNLVYQQALFSQQYDQGEADAAIRQTCITGGDAQRSGRTLEELTHAYNQVPGLSIMARQLMRSAGQDCWQLSKLGVKDGTELIVPY